MKRKWMTGGAELMKSLGAKAFVYGIPVPVIEGCPVVIECEFVEIVNGTNFSTVLARIVNILADETVLDEKGRIDAQKTGMLLYDPFGTNYVTLGGVVGRPWQEGRRFI